MHVCAGIAAVAVAVISFAVARRVEHQWLAKTERPAKHWPADPVAVILVCEGSWTDTRREAFCAVLAPPGWRPAADASPA